jgi:nicotinamide riboside kinase
MTWWEKQGNVAMATGIKGVFYVRHLAETGQENSGKVQEEMSRAFTEESRRKIKMRPEFQALLKRVLEDDSTTVVLVQDLSQWKRFQGTNRRRTKS